MIGNAVNSILTKLYFKLQNYLKVNEFPVDFSQQEIETVRSVQPFTMTSPERIVSLIHSVEYVVKAGIPGSIVECGVWRGGSMMAAAKTLLRCGCNDREIYLFDTYEGMPAPSVKDISVTGASASDEFNRRKISEDASEWCLATVEDVERNLLQTGYPPEMLRFVKGKVEDTIPMSSLDTIALLRLDTDWYESTLHELRHLYPRLAPGGILILDDYGHWQGARKATDEFLAENGVTLLLNRIDNTGRIAVKPLHIQ